ncbi:MAG: preprotein translocase subunit SecA [Bacteroidales bacterium]|jgi:preprotein translocase subunit SecA|nr:preprotein translocase subunit SecA [Bacteroidales bacterium]
MIDKIISIFFGTKHDRDITKLKPLVAKVNALENSVKDLKPEDFKQKTIDFKERVSKGEKIDDLLPEAFALVREASMRTLGMRHFDVQLMGGIVLHQGRIAEMKTGEGKTLMATLPLYLNALSGKGAHIVTVNDYLARRDALWMSPIYYFLGLTVGIIQNDMDHIERQEAYACDITYGTNNEFGFDYLRDNMVEHNSLRVQANRNFCIVDEVDSILIDEARTPLIISGSTEESTKKYFLINKIIPSLKEVDDFEINEKDKNTLLTEDGVKKVEKLLKIDNLYDNKNIELVHHVTQALKAHTLFTKDVDYIVKEGQVVIVDEFTGRLMDGRRYSDGLHQALEAKENVTIARESQTLASITFQNFFRMYSKLAGMTGTADTEAVEFQKIYSLDVAVIPTNQPLIRKDYPDKIYRTEHEKFNAIADEIKLLTAKGQPILVGTISIERSEKLSNMLKSRGIIHNVLNAKFHEKEAQIVSEAGSPGAVTIATNMAGRGTDIVLGGKKTYSDELEAHEPIHDADLWEGFKLAILGNDFEKGESLSADFTGQDKHRAASILRQGKEWVANHEKVKDAGGLHILGTERHESRRIDNQLRGRSGRQGDAGSSRFYLSLEDDLMRLFANERISKVMQRLGMEEGQEIESSMVSKAIAGAQKRVEGRNFEIRKHLLEYDDVMNAQREFIYKERNEILDGADLSDKILSYFEDVVNGKIEYYSAGVRHPEEWDLDALNNWSRSKFLIELDYEKINPFTMTYDEFQEEMVDFLMSEYNAKEKEFGNEDMRTLEGLISLQVIDNKWKQHLLTMDQLRDGIWTVGYGEKNPLVEYKIEGFAYFKEMMLSTKEEILEYMMKVQVDQLIEERDYEYADYGDEYHMDVEQFGSGGVPLGQSRPGNKKNKAQSAAAEGGVKRKKTRRSKRR